MAWRFTLEGDNKQTTDQYYYDLSLISKSYPVIRNSLSDIYSLGSEDNGRYYISQNGYVVQKADTGLIPVAQIVSDKYTLNGELESLYGLDDFARANPQLSIKQAISDYAGTTLSGQEDILVSPSGTVYLYGEDKNLRVLGVLDTDEPVYELSGQDTEGEELYFELGRFKMPKFKAPKMPKFKAPKIKAPKFKAPKMPKMRFKAPKMKFKAPKIKVNTQGFSKGLSNVGKGISKGVSSYGKHMNNMAKGISKGVSSYGKHMNNMAKGIGKGLSSLARGAGDLAETLLSNQPLDQEQFTEELDDLDNNSEEIIESIDEEYNEDIALIDAEYDVANEALDSLEESETSEILDHYPDDDISDDVLDGITDKYDMIRNAIDRIYLGRCAKCSDDYNSRRELAERSITQTAKNLSGISGELGMIDFSAVASMLSPSGTPLRNLTSMVTGGGNLQSLANKASTKQGRTNIARNALTTGISAANPAAGMVANIGLGVYDKHQAAKAAKKRANDQKKQNLVKMLLAKQNPQFAPRVAKKPVVRSRPKQTPKKANTKPISQNTARQTAAQATQVYSSSVNPASDLRLTDSGQKNNTMVVVGGGIAAILALVMINKKGK